MVEKRVLAASDARTPRRYFDSMTAAGHDIGRTKPHALVKPMPRNLDKSSSPTVARNPSSSQRWYGCPSTRPFEIPFRAIPCFVAQEM
jgi:hypothetical protein